MTHDNKLKPLSLQRLIEDIEQLREVTTPAGQAVRLQRAGLEQKLQLAELLDTVETDASGAIASQADALKFGLAVLSASIVDENDVATFNSDKGRRALAALEVSELNFLIDQANELNGFAKAAEKKSD